MQCKRYSLDNPVGRPAIQQFKGVIEGQKAFRGYFVATSRFTQEAIDSAAQSDRIRLIDGSDLVRWAMEGRQSLIEVTALKLEHVLSIPSRFWLNMQKHWDDLAANSR